MLNRIRKALWAFRSGPNISIDQFDQMIRDLEVGQESASGVTVSVRSGSRQATVYSCINILSRDKAAMPLQLYEKTKNGGRAQVKDHPVSEWLRNPNPAMTGYQYRRLGWTQQHAWGNAYSWIQRSGAEEIVTWPLQPDLVTGIGLRPNGRKFYRYTMPDGRPRLFEDDEIIHSFQLSFDGFIGVSPIRHNMEAVGKAIALGEYGSSYFQSPVPKVIVTHPTGFKSDEDYNTFTERWREAYAGKRGLKTIAVMPDGMTIAQVVKIPNDEAQFLESQKLAKEEIAQFYLMPMHRLQGLDHATFSNIEHVDIEYTKYTLLSDLVENEQTLERTLLLPFERERFFLRHNMDGLMRGDFKTRMEGHSIGIMAGFGTRNEAREFEDKPAIEGLDEPLVPLNMGPASQLGKEPLGKRPKTESKDGAIS